MITNVFLVIPTFPLIIILADVRGQGHAAGRPRRAGGHRLVVRREPAAGADAVAAQPGLPGVGPGPRRAAVVHHRVRGAADDDLADRRQLPRRRALLGADRGRPAVPRPRRPELDQLGHDALLGAEPAGAADRACRCGRSRPGSASRCSASRSRCSTTPSTRSATRRCDRCGGGVLRPAARPCCEQSGDRAEVRSLASSTRPRGAGRGRRRRRPRRTPRASSSASSASPAAASRRCCSRIAQLLEPAGGRSPAAASSSAARTWSRMTERQLQRAALAGLLGRHAERDERAEPGDHDRRPVRGRDARRTRHCPARQVTRALGRGAASWSASTRSTSSSYPHQLSGGMRQRAMIAMALLFTPDLVIMDEPTSALDVVAQRSLMVQIKELQRRLGFAVVFVTHDMSLVSHFSDQLLVMYAGQVVEAGPTRTVFDTPAHPYSQGLLDAFPSIRGPRVRADRDPGRAARPGASRRRAAASTRAARSPCADCRPGRPGALPRRGRPGPVPAARRPAARPRCRRRRQSRGARGATVTR